MSSELEIVSGSLLGFLVMSRLKLELISARECLIEVSMSLIKIRNSRGPKMDP